MVTIPEIVAQLVAISDRIETCFNSGGDRQVALEQAQRDVDDLAEELRNV